ncbi:hypothetical protein [Chitinophaga sp. CB10]|uniref:hypothetical protein n=1 Tax=Chitinophaga sp. CB10 TaxID=1891659 RepID=UPI0025C0384D|nr:hypothetical protein [Chitinophaga sp. CB10]
MWKQARRRRNLGYTSTTLAPIPAHFRTTVAAMSVCCCHDQRILEKPLKDIDKFYIAWHLFKQSAIFYVTAGVLEVAGAILLIINRTALLGALFLLPVLGQIFLVDLAFTTNQFGSALVVRLLRMLLADLTIIVYYREVIIKIWHLLYQQVATTFRYKYWIYILLPLIGFATDFLLAIVLYPLRLIVDLIIRK